MKIIPAPFLTIQAASNVVNLSESALRHGCRNGKIPHIRRNGRIYVDILALLDKMDANNDRISPVEKKQENTI